MKLTYKIYFILILSFTIILSSNLQAQKSADIFGKWRTIDDETGEAKSIVEIYQSNGKAYGKIIELLEADKQDSKCNKCSTSDKRYNQPIKGMVIATELEKDGDIWDDGEILDPNNGKIYSCQMWVENGKLQVRGYLGFSWVGRTQVWEKVN